MADSNRRYGDTVHEQLARIGRSLASEPRLEILDVLCQGTRTVEVAPAKVHQ